MDVQIKHSAGHVEAVPSRATDHPLHFELRRHVFLTPLGPGDVVAVTESMQMIGVVSLKPQWIYEVDLYLPADYLTSTLPPEHPAVKTASRLVDQWSRHAPVTLLTTFSMVMGSPSPHWFHENVASSRYVLGSSVIRTPDVASLA